MGTTGVRSDLRSHATNGGGCVHPQLINRYRLWKTLSHSVVAGLARPDCDVTVVDENMRAGCVGAFNGFDPISEKGLVEVDEKCNIQNSGIK